MAVPLASKKRPRTGKTRDFILGDYGLQILLMFDLGDTRDLPNFPRMLYSLERRDPTHAIPFLEKRLAQLSSIPVMTLAVRGAAGATKKRWPSLVECG